MAVAEKAPATAAGGGQWRVFTGNETGVLLAHWLWTQWKSRRGAGGAAPPPPGAPPPLVIASTVSSKMLAAVAAAEGFAFQETLTGFKWMGNAMADAHGRGQEVLFAFEVSRGGAGGGAPLQHLTSCPHRRRPLASAAERYCGTRMASQQQPCSPRWLR